MVQAVLYRGMDGLGQACPASLETDGDAGMGTAM